MVGDVDSLHVEIDNLNNPLVGFCFIRSIDSSRINKIWINHVILSWGHFRLFTIESRQPTARSPNNSTAHSSFFRTAGFSQPTADSCLFESHSPTKHPLILEFAMCKMIKL
jgi:hypothetical protein